MTESALRLCADFLARDDIEGFSATPYQDSGGTWTIGIGSIWLSPGHPVTRDTEPITREQAEELMMAELRPTAALVDGMVHVPLTDPQRAALYSFAYNLGTGALRGSTLLSLLNQGDYAGAAVQFGAWVYCRGVPLRGLINRRVWNAPCSRGNHDTC